MTVVVGYIPTREGRAALHQASAEAVLRRCDLVLVRVRRDEHDPEEVRRLEEAWVRVRTEVAAEGLALVEHDAPESRDLATTLMDVAEDRSAACIVIGLRRRSAIGKLVLGSSAQRVLLEAACPVIAVKAPR